MQEWVSRRGRFNALACYEDGARSAFEAGLRRTGEHVTARVGRADTEGLPGARFAAFALALGHGRYTRRPVRALRVAMFRVRRAIRRF